MSDNLTFGDRVKGAWNAFFNKDPTKFNTRLGTSQYMNPNRIILRPGTGKSIVAAVYNRIAMDVAAVKIQHVRVDQNGQFIETINSGLNECLTVSANIDQTGRQLIQDAVMTMFDQGVAAIVPVDTTVDPDNGTFDVKSLRVGQIVEWYPKHVRIRAYNEITGKRQEIVMHKDNVAIIENPFYTIMNAPNSTLQRLIRKLALLDAVDEATGSNKLDLIIQMPYTIKSPARKKQAEDRISDIEQQLRESPYGIAYTDGTEKIVQLNRSVENNLFKQVEYLTETLYSQLGLSTAIFNGTATEEQRNDYNNRTLEPILSTICNEMKRVYLSKTARSQSQTIDYFQDPFKLVTTSQMAELADKLTRNEIMSPNELRQVLCMKPSDDPQADQLRNRNISPGEGQEFATTVPGGEEETDYDETSAVLNLQKKGV